MSTSTQLKHIPWKDVEREQLNPLIDREMLVGNKIMLARVLMKKGAHVPLHQHHNEQVTYILEGALKFAIDGKEIVVRAGEVLCIPSNMPHEAWALEDTVDLDVFDAPRPLERSENGTEPTAQFSPRRSQAARQVLQSSPKHRDHPNLKPV
jgi:quercetin dioxygenase-like cupin family protein